MARFRLSLTSKVAILGLSVVLSPRTASAQFSWDGNCGFNWHECCSAEQGQCENNWSVPSVQCPQCPVFPGPDDYVSAGGTILLTSPVQVKSLNISGLFIFACTSCGGSQQLNASDELNISGSIFAPTTFLFQSWQTAILLTNPDASVSISAFATLDFQTDGAIGSLAPRALLTNDGTILKSDYVQAQPGNPQTYTELNVEVDNNGLITVEKGILVLGAGATNNGVIEALENGIVQFRGPASYVLDGEVRGAGGVHFLNSEAGGGTSIIGDYHPTNTRLSNGHVVNFDVESSINNLEISGGGLLGGVGQITISDLTWYDGSTMLPGATTIVENTALFKNVFGTSHMDLQRDMELHGDSIIDSNTNLRMQQSELRNYGELELRNNSNIRLGCGGCRAGIKNFGTIRKTSGGTSLIDVGVSNDGSTIEVESGTLRLESQLGNVGAITVAAGATLHLGLGQQSFLPQGSITGAGTVKFATDEFDPETDVINGPFDVAATTIATIVELQTDVTTGSLTMTGGKLTGTGDMTVAGQLNWGTCEMAGGGTTFVQGPMNLTNWAYLSRTLELNSKTPPEALAEPPSFTMFINPAGTLRGDNATIDGHVSSSGLVSPGVSIGYLHITGSYSQNPGGMLQIERDGGPDHDALLVDGPAYLSGTLTVTGFPATGGQSYTILTAQSITGAFGQVNVPTGMTVIYTPTSVILQAAPGIPCFADIAPSPNGNGVVDVDDLLAVINDWGSCKVCAADLSPAKGGGNGVVDVDDLLEVINAWGLCN